MSSTKCICGEQIINEMENYLNRCETCKIRLHNIYKQYLEMKHPNKFIMNTPCYDTIQTVCITCLHCKQNIWVTFDCITTDEFQHSCSKLTI